ncbi:hypothetical protein D3C80_1293540 [compost metagenome]
MQLALQHVVGQVADIADIAEDVMHAVFEKLRGYRLIALRQRLERINIEGVVEAEDRPIEAFPRVIFSSLRHQRKQCQAGTDKQSAQSIDPVRTEYRHQGLSLRKSSRPTQGGH